MMIAEAVEAAQRLAASCNLVGGRVAIEAFAPERLRNLLPAALVGAALPAILATGRFTTVEDFPPTVCIRW